MKRFYHPLIVAATVGLASLACSVNLPSLPFGPQIQVGQPGQFKIGPEQTDSLKIARTGSPTALHLQLAAGKLLLRGGGTQLLTGSATYNIADFKPVVEGAGTSWTVRTGDVSGFSAAAVPQFVNNWDMTLGTDPLDMSFEFGAAKADIDLGHTAVSRLSIDAGASEIALAFSTPNQASMDSLMVNAGAAQLNFSRLANANTKRMDFTLGGGDVGLDFSGRLDQDLEVTINGVAGNFTINVPEGTKATLTTSGGLISVNPQGGWTSTSGGYSQEGGGAEIHVRITAGAGNVNLRSD
jgi:hypothetical protein